jgi:hypothetical protein
MSMVTPDPLEAEYHALLARRGLKRLPDDCPARHINPYDEVKARILHTLRLSGIELPSPVYVGDYPHGRYNAQARAVPTGTLILVNTGLLTLLYQVAESIGASILEITSTGDGPTYEQPTAELTRRRDEARDLVAKAVVEYIFHGDARFVGLNPMAADSRARFGLPFADAATDFVVAHEFGHLLAGHLHEAPTQEFSKGGIRANHRREYEADEIAALLLMRGQDPEDNICQNIAVTGPFLFFAIDHLITRVRSEIDDIPAGAIVTGHPRSDERGAALRRLFVEIAGPGVLQMANAIVTSFSGEEDRILDTVDGLVHT